MRGEFVLLIRSHGLSARLNIPISIFSSNSSISNHLSKSKRCETKIKRLSANDHNQNVDRLREIPFLSEGLRLSKEFSSVLIEHPIEKNSGNKG